MRLSTLVAGAGSLALTTSLLTAPVQAAGQDPELIVDGLIGPLSLDVGKRGDVYVTQSFAMELSKVTSGGDVESLYRLPVEPGAGEIVGVARSGNTTYHIENDYSGEAPTSHIVRTSGSGDRTVVSDDFWEYEIAQNPDADVSYGLVGLTGYCAGQVRDWEEQLGGGPILSEYTGIVESHAYQMDVSGRRIYVADAAGNTLLSVDTRTGDISTVAVIPPVQTTFTEELEDYLEEQTGTDVPNCVVGKAYVPESVPTDVQIGRGAMYVSTLGGAAGEVEPLSQIHRVWSGSGRTAVVADGLLGATGLDVAKTGHLVVAEMFGGRVSVITPGSTTPQTLFNAPPPGDVVISGNTVYATTNVFENGSLVRYDYSWR